MDTPKVVVVDDDPTNVSLIKMLLEMDGFQVSPCGAITEAIDAATPEHNAFVIDCNLARGESGMDLLTAVRQNNTAAPANTLVIMTSGDHRLEDEALTKGANLFMLKPYSPGELSKMLLSLLNEGASNG